MIRSVLASAALAAAAASGASACFEPASSPAPIPAVEALRAAPSPDAIRAFNAAYGEGTAYRHVGRMAIRDAAIEARMPG